MSIINAWAWNPATSQAHTRAILSLCTRNKTNGCLLLVFVFVCFTNFTNFQFRHLYKLILVDSSIFLNYYEKYVKRMHTKQEKHSNVRCLTGGSVISINKDKKCSYLRLGCRWAPDLNVVILFYKFLVKPFAFLIGLLTDLVRIESTSSYSNENIPKIRF